jgi:hypothetical protein
MKDITGNPWKFDAVQQGEGMANSGSWLRTGTFTAAATDICTQTGHNMQTGIKVRVEEGNSDLPLNLAESTDYWVNRIDANTFYLYTGTAGQGVNSGYDNAIAGGATGRVDIGDAGTTPNYILMQPTFDHKIFIKNIMIIGDGTNDGTVVIHNSSGGRVIAQAEIFSATTGVEANVRIPIYDYVDGLYLTTLDAANAIVLVYHGR